MVGGAVWLGGRRGGGFFLCLWGCLLMEILPCKIYDQLQILYVTHTAFYDVNLNCGINKNVRESENRQGGARGGRWF
ncbi:hypothetical protein CMI37_29885 [Candidatus Pacearchaeota archaeon]|nr:hypothetical protein [Candidatus Pacearchaeota archaeon]